jgi:hypothetical protein
VIEALIREDMRLDPTADGQICEACGQVGCEETACKHCGDRHASTPTEHGDMCTRCMATRWCASCEVALPRYRLTLTGNGDDDAELFCARCSNREERYPVLTAQQIFDQVARHLLTQGQRATDPISDGCRYRTFDGRSCAVGCLLTPEEAQAADEADTAGVQDLVAFHLLPARLLGHVELLHQLQQVHDIDEPCDWRAELRVVAEDHQLSAAVLEELAS